MLPLLANAVPRASVTLLDYVLAELGPNQPQWLGGNTGLPACAVELLEHNLVLAATEVTAPLFDEALLRFAASTRRDTVLVRHGFYPETLDPVRGDVALRSATGPILVRDLSFFRHVDGVLHLAPARPDLFIDIGRSGLGVSLAMPWNSWDERSAGLERAAAEIVRACRDARAGSDQP